MALSWWVSPNKCCSFEAISIPLMDAVFFCQFMSMPSCPDKNASDSEVFPERRKELPSLASIPLNVYLLPLGMFLQNNMATTYIFSRVFELISQCWYAVRHSYGYTPRQELSQFHFGILSSPFKFSTVCNLHFSHESGSHWPMIR